MLTLDDVLQKKIADIVDRVRDVEWKASMAESLDSDQIVQIAFSCTEIALLAFAASDSLEEDENIGDRLLQREIATALWSIALHCVEIQAWQGEATIRSNIRAIGKQCTAILSMTGLPEPDPDVTALDARGPEDIILPDTDTKIHQDSPAGSLESAAESEETALSPAPPPADQVRRLKMELKALREILAALVLRRDNLLLVESKELESLYMKELGYLELEVYAAESNARYLQRKYEMMQAAVNRQEPVNTSEIDKKLNEKYEEFKKVYEEFRKKAKDAEDTVRRRRQNAQNAADGAGRSSERAEKLQQPEDSSEKQEQGVSRLKQLYRKIVKAMHPDLHPDQDERTKELFKRAMVAYEEGDLQTLEEITQIIDGEDPENPVDLIASLLKEKERLQGLIQSIRAQITLILSRFPFTRKELLHDPVRLEAEKEKLKQRLERAKRRAEAYQQKIEELKKNGRADHKAE